MNTSTTNLTTCPLPEFAALVLDAARHSPTGRWHGGVFISHVWARLETFSFADGVSYAQFQRRLIEVFQADLLDLSRADLVDAMPADDVRASETTHYHASFHFVRPEG